MVAKTIQLPCLPAGLTLTVKVRNLTTLALLETVTCSFASDIYSGTITGAHAGQLLFELLASGTVFDHRIRTIQDVAATFVILTELERVANDGRGAHAVTITITDGTNPLENATVRVASGVLSESKDSNVSGVAGFALNSATYTITITRAGYASRTVTLAVSGATSQTYALTALVVTPPSSPLVSTGTMLVLDEFNEPEPSKSISLQMVEGPGTAGYALDEKVRTEVSNGSGIVQFIKLRRGATYSVWRGPAADTFDSSAFVSQAAASRRTFVVPNVDSFNIDEVLGLDPV